jgi:hypothetical protein
MARGFDGLSAMEGTMAGRSIEDLPSMVSRGIKSMYANCDISVTVGRE